MADGTAFTRSKRALAGLAVLALATTAACGSDDEDTADFCEKYRSYEDQNQEVGEQFQDDPENVDLEEAKGVFTDIANQIEDLAGEAPDEIKDDVATISDATTELADQVEQAEDPEQLLEAITGAAEGADETEDASQRVEDWTQDNCDSDGAK